MLATLPPVQNRPRAPRKPATAPSVPKAPASPFTLAHFRTWAADLILDTGQSWRPEAFQDAFMEDVFSGRPECWLVVPEGNGKTTLVAGLALYHAEFRPHASVPIAASSREQAEIMYRQAEGFVLRSERLYASTHSAIQAAKGKRKTDVPRFTCLEGYRRINHFAGGRIQVFAADDRTGDGVIPTLGIIDEMHRHRDLALYRTWAGKLAKRGGQIVGISTSGEPGSDFEETRERIRDTSEDVQRTDSFIRASSPRVVLHEWAVPESADPEDFAAVKRANPFSGVTVEMLAEKYASPTMTMQHWLRFVCNRPTRDVESWLGPNAETIWQGLTEPYSFKTDVPIYLGIDMALKHDTSAVVAVQKRDDGRFHATCRIWTPTETRPIDVTDVMQHIRELSRVYKITAASFDPKYFDIAAKMLGDEGIPMAEVVQSTTQMTTAIGFLYAAIQGGQLTHDDDPAFAKQVLNAVPRYNDTAFTLAKSKSHGKIDAAIALALAYDQALRHEEEPDSTYLERGLVAV